MSEFNENGYLYSWVKKGVGNQISEAEKVVDPEDLKTLAEDDGAILERPSIQLSVQLNATAIEDGTAPTETTQAKDFLIVGPGDVLNINSNAVMNFYPPSNHENFPVEYKPYIEFWEPDFAWRYTPAKASAEGKLRPWLAVVACETSKCSVSKNSNGTSLVSFDINDESEYAKIFPNPADIWKSAHAQGNDNSMADFCRIVSVNREDLNPHAEYTAFVIPVFETTRLRALGCDDDVQKTIAQKPAWEESFSEQEEQHRYPFTFPAFFSWKFKTGKETFETLVKALTPYSTDKSGIDVDVTDLGDGLSYSILGSDTPTERKSIVMPAATQTTGNVTGPAFPSPDENDGKNEHHLFNRLKRKLDMSSVFQENQQLIDGDTYQEKYDDDDNSDPVVAPPIYGGKHAMATGFDMKNPSWLEKVNLDLHYRAAAGLGKKIIQEHQEQFVNRAWKQVEVVKALNGELHKKLLSSKVNDSLKNKTYKGVFNQKQLGNDSRDNEKFLQNLMMSLNSMKSTTVGDLSIDKILGERKFPSTFATPSFQSKTQQLSLKLDGMDLSSLIENVTKNDFYKIPKPKDFNYFSLESLDFFAYQVLLHSRLYARKLMSKKDKARLGSKNYIKENGMQLWPVFNYLSIHKRAPQYIKWRKLDYSNLKGLSDKVYKFQKISTNFATYSQFISAVEHEFPPQKLILKSRWAFLSKYIGFSIDNVIKSVDENGTQHVDFETSYDADKNLKVESMLDKVPSYGSVYVSHDKEMMTVGNVIGLSSLEYVSLFGEKDKIITKIDKCATLGEDYYFVNRDRLIEEMENAWKEYREAEKSSEEEAEKPLIIRYVMAGSVIDDEFVDFEDAQKKVSQWKYSLKQPDIINIRAIASETPEFVEEYIDEITSVYDWVQVYLEKDNSDPAIQEYKKYEAFRKKLNPAVFEAPVIPDGKGLSELENGIDENTQVANDRAVEVISNYFSVFLNSDAGQGLRDEFVNDCLNSKFPIMAYPQFPEPTYYYLKQLSDKFILPCVDDLPDNTVSMFKSNEAFVESFLCGMNTEMGRELLWREYPTDQRGSYFRKFWDTETSINNILDYNFFDIKSVHTWNNDLGENHNPSKSQLIMFAIRGKLMKVYPDTKIYLHKATCVVENGKKIVRPMAVNSENEIKNDDGTIDKIILEPVAQAFFRDDIYLVGFKIPFTKAIGSPNGPNHGYMLVFKQMMENLNFQYNSKKCNSSYEYAYNADVDQNSFKDKEVTDQAIVKPYISAKHVFVYAQKVAR